MTIAAAGRGPSGAAGDETGPADALVFFGASGDLARRQICPALHGLVRRRQLEVPIIAVSRSIRDLETLRDRVRQSVAEHGVPDPTVFERLAGLLRLVVGDDADPGTLAGSRRPSARRSARSMTSPYRRACSRPLLRHSGLPSAPHEAGSSSKSPLGAPADRAARDGAANSLADDAICTEKAKLLGAVEPIRPQDVVRGQYDGYRLEDGVRAGSTTETYAALRMRVDTWRSAGVPFLIRAGSACPSPRSRS